MSDPLKLISLVSLLLAGCCAFAIAADIALGRRQEMWIMNLVWPITALYGGPIALLVYWRFGRMPMKPKPFAMVAAVATTHCGAGCTIGDIIAELFVLAVPIVLFGRPIFGGWLIAFIAAYLIGIIFQYFTIAPMRHLSLGHGIWAAIKADTLSLIAWQIGMYGWMAIVTFVIFHRELSQKTPTFWFMMQIPMLVGFLTGYPANWWLVRSGVKEKM